MKTVRTIHLPAVDLTVSLAAYVRAVKLAKSRPDEEFKHGTYDLVAYERQRHNATVS